MSTDRPLTSPPPARLSGEQAALLPLEDHSATPQNVGCVLRFAGRAPGLGELTDRVSEALEGLPGHRARLAAAPLGAGRPLWSPDPEFEPAQHVMREGLPPGERALERLAARVFATPLDRGRPLWELLAVEEPGGFALIVKCHAALGGGLAAALLAPGAARPPDPDARASRLPAGPLELLRGVRA